MRPTLIRTGEQLLRLKIKRETDLSLRRRGDVKVEGGRKGTADVKHEGGKGR